MSRWLLFILGAVAGISIDRLAFPAEPVRDPAAQKGSISENEIVTSDKSSIDPAAPTIDSGALREDLLSPARKNEDAMANLQQQYDELLAAWTRLDDEQEALIKEFDLLKDEVYRLREKVGTDAWQEFQKDLLYTRLTQEQRNAIEMVFTGLGERLSDAEVWQLADWYPEFLKRINEATDRWHAAPHGSPEGHKLQDEVLALQPELVNQMVRILGFQRAQKYLGSEYFEK